MLHDSCNDLNRQGNPTENREKLNKNYFKTNLSE